jgi:uncharacterized protein
MPPLVACPTCREKSEFSIANRWRPFCSERCKLIDLGAWANEEYRVAGKSAVDEDGLTLEEDPPSAAANLGGKLSS